MDECNPKCKTENSVLEENIGQKLHEFGYGYNFLDVTPKAPATKEKIYKLDFMEI